MAATLMDDLTVVLLVAFMAVTAALVNYIIRPHTEDTREVDAVRVLVSTVMVLGAIVGATVIRLVGHL